MTPGAPLPQDSCWLDAQSPHCGPPRASTPGQTRQGRGALWTTVSGPLPSDVARGPEEDIPSPPSHQSDSTRTAAKPVQKAYLLKFCGVWAVYLAKTKLQDTFNSFDSLKGSKLGTWLATSFYSYFLFHLPSWVLIFCFIFHLTYEKVEQMV